MNRFVCLEAFLVDGEVTLSPEESHHLSVVLRQKAGELVILIDGKGGLAKAEILASHKTQTRLKVTENLKALDKPLLTIAFGLSKAPAIDFIFHRCTEIGLAAFQPLKTDHAQKYSSFNIGRFSKVVLEVLKQCEGAYLPEVREPIDLLSWLEGRQKVGLISCDETDRETKEALPKKQFDLVIGPEGGLSARERQALQQAGALRFGLGQNRLRTETAALVAAILVKRSLGEM